MQHGARRECERGCVGCLLVTHVPQTVATRGEVDCGRARHLVERVEPDGVLVLFERHRQVRAAGVETDEADRELLLRERVLEGANIAGNNVAAG